MVAGGLGLFLLLVTFVVPAVMAISNLQLKVPKQTVRGGSIVLNCSYDMQNDLLYAVKWYKDDHEFFRYMPSDTTMTFRPFPVQGIQLDLSHCTANLVFLKDLTLNSSGTYKCEVSAEAPSFQTLRTTSDMQVLAVPKEAPRIGGLMPSYNVADIVTANCSSRSKPAGKLAWYINGNQADAAYLDRGGTSMDPDGLETVVLGLRFRAENKHFPGGAMRLKCEAKVGSNGFWVKDTTHVATFHVQEKLNRPKKYSSGGDVGASSTLLCFLLTMGIVNYHSFYYALHTS